MKLTLYRINEEENTTIGALFVDGKFQCFTLEDENRLVKVKGKTRIPDGTYQIKQRKEVSPLTERYRQRYPFFDFHFEIQNVPNFTHVYIHVGNDHTHTDGYWWGIKLKAIRLQNQITLENQPTRLKICM
jgi:hypothetical protein